jgi:hypothetical protein
MPTAQQIPMRFIDIHRDPWHALGGEDGPPVGITPAPHLLLDVFVRERDDGERFADVVARLGIEAFKRSVYVPRSGDDVLKEAA